jgi:hypothetical protein
MRGVLMSLAVFVSSAIARPVEPVRRNWLDGLHHEYRLAKVAA